MGFVSQRELVTEGRAWGGKRFYEKIWNLGKVSEAQERTAEALDFYERYTKAIHE